MENGVYALLRTRDMAVSRYKEFGIPVDWLSDSGVVGKVTITAFMSKNWPKFEFISMFFMINNTNYHSHMLEMS